MCIQSESMIKEEITVTNIKPARKTRTKIRKPKFLSLRLELSPENTPPPSEMPSTTSSDHSNHQHHPQLNLFPLHPENLVEEKDITQEDNNVACLFSTGDVAATTLTGLLEENHQSPSSVDYVYGGGRKEEDGELVRTAMRNRERDDSEEKWVCYSKVVEMIKEEEVNSNYGKDQRQRLSLKLDYQKIMNAWSDKGPLYIHLDSPQTVPDIHDDDFPSSATVNGLRQGWESSNGGVWRVPEMTSVKEEAIGWEEGMNMNMKGQREASVQRYKEKRQNRLFAKTIRYQVRKLNAEKRPRLKGRFVKRS